MKTIWSECGKLIYRAVQKAIGAMTEAMASEHRITYPQTLFLSFFILLWCPNFTTRFGASQTLFPKTSQ